MNARLAGLGALLPAMALCFGATWAAEDVTRPVPSFAGRWKLNPELSDKPPSAPVAKPEKETKEAKDAKDVKPRHEDAPPKAGEAGATAPPAAASGAFTVHQSDVEIVAEDEAGLKRNFYPNGRTYKADEGTSSVKSTWKNGSLLFEKRNERGWKHTETWQLTPDGHLRVDTRLEGGGQRTTVSKRVYDRIP